MTAPDLEALERTLMQLDGGVSLLLDLAVQLPDDESNAADGIHYLARALKRDIKDARAWFDATHDEHVAAKRVGPVAVA